MKPERAKKLSLAQEKYNRIEESAWKEYLRIGKLSSLKYKYREKQAREEFDRMKETAWAKYQRTYKMALKKSGLKKMKVTVTEEQRGNGNADKN